ncbi:MAG: cation transporter [Candidatus Micrarchaeia archaeon]
MRASFKVSMHCASCEKILEMAVGWMDGVNSVNANKRSGKLSVDFGTPATRSWIESVIISEGYPING